MTVQEKLLIKKLGMDIILSSLMNPMMSRVNNKLLLFWEMLTKWGLLECLVSLIHVTSITELSLKEEIYFVHPRLSLSPLQLWGQGYDGASNMRVHIHGFRSLILQENPSTHHVHCFDHQLQFTVVAVVSGHPHIKGFLELVNLTLDVVGGSEEDN